MNRIKKQLMGLSGACVLAMASAPAMASLTPFQTYTGNVALSTDGVGSTSTGGMSMTANIPAGSTVVAAYLYTASYNGSATNPSSTLGGSNVTYGPAVVNTSATYLASYRADVTSIVQAAYDGVGGAYNLDYTESAASTGSIDGSALVVVYRNAALPTATVAILDGFSALGGDEFNVNFSQPLNTADPDFFVDMRLGISFSCCSQASNVSVNDTLITTVAGNNDDGLGSISNGQLITMGGDNDPYSALLPTYENDHERYNLVPYVADGASTIKVNTVNPSNNDNIFLATFFVSGLAAVNEPPPGPTTNVPEPGTLALLGAGLLGMGLRRGRAKRTAA